MGGNSSSRLDSFDSDDAGGVTIVKGIRLTDRVIDRMKESPQEVYQRPQSKSPAHPPAGQPAAPHGQLWSSGERLVPILPHPPSYASSLVPPPDAPQPGGSPTHSAEAVTASPVESFAQEHIAVPPTEPISVTPSPPTESSSVTSSPLVESVAMSSSTSAEPSEPMIQSHFQPVEAVIPPATTEPIATPVEPSVSLSTSEPIAANSPAEPVVLSTITVSLVDSANGPMPTAPAPEPPSPDAQLSMPAPSLQEPVPSPSSIHVEPSEIQSDTITKHDEHTDILGSPLGEPPSSSLYLSTPAVPEELVPPQSSSALAIPSELPSVGQRGLPPTEETPASPNSAPSSEPAVAPVLPALSEGVSTPKPCAAVKEAELRQQIKDELQKQLQEEIKIEELKIQQQLKDEETKAKAEAETKVRLQVQAKVQKVLEEDQITLQQSLKDAVMKERMKAEDGRLVAQYYWMERKIQKLEEKERDLAKQDSLYREQIMKLEEKTALFTRVTAESFKKGLEDSRSRFKKYQIKPACSELQSEILKCYKENTGQTLTCSNIASLYMQCVDNAVQNKKVSTGG